MALTAGDDLHDAAATIIASLAPDPAAVAAALTTLDDDAQQRVMAALRLLLSPADQAEFCQTVFGGFAEEEPTR